MEKLLERVTALESAMQGMEGRQEAAERRANRWRAVAAVLALLGMAGLAPQAGYAQLTLDQRVAALEAKLRFLTTTGTSMVISGANLFLRNGTGATASVNGLGNLIIGYNELRPRDSSGNDPNVRTGSHNLVLGSRTTSAAMEASSPGIPTRSAGRSPP